MLKSATRLDALAKRMSWEIYTPKDVERGTSPSKNGKLTISKSKSSRLSFILVETISLDIDKCKSDCFVYCFIIIYQSKSNKRRPIKVWVSSCKFDKAFYLESVQELNILFPAAWGKYFLTKPIALHLFLLLQFNLTTANYFWKWACSPKHWENVYQVQESEWTVE